MGTPDGPRLEVLTGGRAGLLFPLAGDILTVGRGTECHVRLDPDADLQVSGRHAALRRTSEGWKILDLSSRNGTTVNGDLLEAERLLRDGDRIQLGGGPVLAYHATAPATAVTRAVPAHRHGLWRLVAGGLLLLVVAGGGAFLIAQQRARRAWDQERQRMQQRLDSLQRVSEQTEASLRGQVSGLADALRASRTEVTQLRTDLDKASARGDAAGTAALRQRLQAATTTLHHQQLAAGLDFAAIQRANRRAVALLYVEYEDGRVATATAFAVNPDATLVTNKHVLLGPNGTEHPRRIGIQFSDSEQVWPARLIATADASDLAVVKVDNIEGAVPAVRVANVRPDTLAQGAAVAVIGFPLGGDESTVLPNGRGRVVRPLLAAGTLRQVRADELEIQGYGAAGASGSPIFDGTGALLGVLYGGRRGEGGQVLYAVPAAAAARLLAGVRHLTPP